MENVLHDSFETKAIRRRMEEVRGDLDEDVQKIVDGARDMGQSSQPAFQELRDLAQQQIADRLRQVETHVQSHPAVGIAAAICIGIFLGWMIKRKSNS